MARRAFTPEQIINKLREAEVHLSQGDTVSEASRKIGVTEQTYYRWRRDALCPRRGIPLFAQACIPPVSLVASQCDHIPLCYSLGTFNMDSPQTGNGLTEARQD